MSQTPAFSSALALLFILSNAAISIAQQPAQGSPPGQGQPSTGLIGGQQPQPIQQRQGPFLSASWDYMITGNPSAGNLTYVPTPSQNIYFALIDDASRNSGMTLAPADPALRAHLGLRKAEGLIVTAIDPGCPAAAAGIQQNDVLIRLGEDGERSVALAKPDELEKGLKATGEHPVTMVLLRAGKELKLKVQPRLKAALGPVPSEAPASPGYWIGVQASTVEPALRAQLQLPEDQGLIIVEVFKDSPAARAGLQVHDIFLKMDDVPMTDTDALTKHVQSRGDRPVKIELLRGGRKQETQVTPERRKMGSFVSYALPKIAQFDVVLPGAVLSGQEAQNRESVIERTRQFEELIQRKKNARKDPKADPAPPAGAPGSRSVEQRLDELSGQIKELRAAIEALAKATEKK